MLTYAVILAGGRGERFWPASRRTLPKQFLRLFGAESLLQLTSRRIAPVCPALRQRFVIDYGLSPLLRREMNRSRTWKKSHLRPANIIHEPYGRNTAPAIALAAAYCAREAPNSTMVVLPADHLIHNEAGFQQAVRFAAGIAAQGYLVTFGIPPTRPDTNYGYIELGERLAAHRAQAAFKVRRFCEKPALSRARAYLRGGRFWWNSGMFVWRTDVFLHAVARYMPAFHRDLLDFQRRIGTPGEKRALEGLYRRAESRSVDYAIMEPARNVAVVRAEFDWDDVGSWSALDRHFPHSTEGNTALGSLAALDTQNCLTMTDCGIVGLIGCRDLVVVRSGDAVLVCPRERSSDIKRLLVQISRDRTLRRHL